MADDSLYDFTSADLVSRLSQRRLIELTDNEDTPTGAVVEAVATTAFVRAEAAFHLAAGKYYVVPIVPPSALPVTVRESLLDLAAFFLMTRKPEWLADESRDGKYWMKLKSWLDDWLEGLSSKNRDSVLPGVAEIAAPVASRGEASVESDEPRFSSTSMKGFF